MKYLGTKEISKLWKVSERSVRNYCREGKVEDAVFVGKTWQIPENAMKPKRACGNNLLFVLKEEKSMKYKGGIYHKTQIELTYNSNHIEGSRLTEEQTRLIFETNAQILQLHDFELLPAAVNFKANRLNLSVHQFKRNILTIIGIFKNIGIRSFNIPSTTDNKPLGMIISQNDVHLNFRRVEFFINHMPFNRANCCHNK